MTSITTVTAVTWNVQFGTHVAVAAADIERQPRLMASDVLLLQEMDDDGTAWLADRFDWQHVYHHIGHHRQTGRPFGNAVLSRHRIEALPRADLPEQARFRGHPRHMTVALVELPVGLAGVGSVHLETPWLGVDKRAAQLAAAVEHLDTVDDGVAGGGLPLLVGGDINTFTHRGRARLAARAGAYRLHAPPGPTVRWQGLGWPIDQFITRGFDLVDSWVGAPSVASDHQPFWARFELAGDQLPSA